ncbi:MAG: DUF1508 domain-containing protein [Firmicutes bacterium]|nr:DUF1508 domain-containing protein [Candidatus Caballimonas caccae]
MGTFIIKKTPTGGFNFGLIASNGEKIATATQVYTTKATCKTGINSVIKTSSKCIEEDKIEDKTLKKVEEKTCPKFEIYFDKANMYRYRLIASNGECVAIAEEGYKSKNGVLNGIKSVAVTSKDAKIEDQTK